MRRISLSRSQFTAVSSDKKARRATSSHFTLVISSAGIGTAVVVSKKVEKTSVGRHQIKRRVREALAASRFPSHQYALLVYARAGAAGLSFAEIQEEIGPLLPLSV